VRRDIARRDEAQRDLQMAYIAGILAATSAGILLLLAIAASPVPARAATPAGQATPTAGALHVRVVNLRNSTGKVICTLFNSPAGFPADSTKALAQVAVPIKDDAAVCSFGGLAPGKYALVVFHDENSNGKFDRNWLGMPKEGFAFSNNVRPVFSPPSFDDAAFDYAGGDRWLTVAMQY
jgi:uncharacterized protein (DUF2141 family)